MIGPLHEFASRTDLAQALLARIQGWSAAQDAPHRLELSGGSTPKELLAAMAGWQMPESLKILPVDDRCVAKDHEHSNFGMFQAAFGGGTLQPLFDAEAGISPSVDRLRDGADLPRFTILGMGPDGHTASLFPGSADLAKGLDPCAPAFIAAQPTMNPMVPRITMSAPYILAADHLVLHIHGAEKRALLEVAKDAAPTTYPIAHFLRHPSKQLEVYYAD